MSSSNIWKVRTVKNYPEAKNHIIVGEVLDKNNTYLKIRGRTYHYGKYINRINDIVCGDLDSRIIPWHRVEIINELPADFKYATAEMGQLDGYTIILSDGKETVPFITLSDKVF